MDLQGNNAHIKAMTRIARPSPPEHILLVDTNILWHEDKAFVVNPDFDNFWSENTGSFPMKLIIPEVVREELLFQQTKTAFKSLDKVNQELTHISQITGKRYSHRVTTERKRHA